VINNNAPVPQRYIEQSIMLIRGHRVMLSTDLAALYGVPVHRLNEQVKRNRGRFPEDFMFQLSPDEWSNLKSQIAISSWGGVRRAPYVFSEQGAVMASAQSAIYNLQSEMPRGRIGFGPDDNRTGSSSDFIARDRPHRRRR
jgi:hypothetical protein